MRPTTEESRRVLRPMRQPAGPGGSFLLALRPAGARSGRVNRAAFLLPAGLALGGWCLAGDITPPPGLATAQAQGLGLPPTAAPPTVPGRTPDLAAGALIFAEKCAPCHGESGDGQGPQASALPNPPTALREAEGAQRAVPRDWFRL